jgi:hypothetical protein
MVAIDIDFDFQAPSKIFLAKPQSAKDAKSIFKNRNRPISLPDFFAFLAFCVFA